MTSLKRLQFSAYCDTEYGQFVYICGNIPQLGNWNPLKGLRLYTQQSFYPIWKSFNTVLVIEKQPIQFKICIVTSKYQFKWEKLTNNRIIIPKMDAYIKLYANQFESYEVLPFNQRNQPVRRGIDNVLNDLSSDGSSSISFKSNYKFYKYFQTNEEQEDRIQCKRKRLSYLKALNTINSYKNSSSQKSTIKSQNQLLTYIDSIKRFHQEQFEGQKLQVTFSLNQHSKIQAQKQYLDEMTSQNYQNEADDILNLNIKQNQNFMEKVQVISKSHYTPTKKKNRQCPSQQQQQQKTSLKKIKFLKTPSINSPILFK